MGKFEMLCDALPAEVNWGDQITPQMVEEIIMAEREACAGVAERWGETHDAAVTVNARNAGGKIARGIRMRSNVNGHLKEKKMNEKELLEQELLELSGRSVGGIEFVPDMGWIAVDAGGNRGAWWNPLDDDGDAMRLVVQLRIDIEFDGEKVQAWFVAPRPGWENGAVYQWIEPLGDDPYAATRRAIVHAAAEMSKTPNAEIRGGEAVPLD